MQVSTDLSATPPTLFFRKGKQKYDYRDLTDPVNMTSTKIINLEELILQYLEKDLKITNVTITNLTAPGENYGSEIFKVDIKLVKGDKKSEELHIVAKQIPESEYYQEVFNVQETFNAEKEFYMKVLPNLHKFQKKIGVQIFDPFPKFYGARNNLNQVDNVVDRNGLILLENLKPKGFKILDRSIGFDFKTTQFILKTLAQFHAAFLSFKHQDPNGFEKNVKKYLGCFRPRRPKVNIDSGVNMLMDLLKKSENCKHLVDTVRESFKFFDEFPEIREPFFTVVHRDFWVNNILLNFKNDQVNDVKIIDFQLYSYDTPASDLLFFIFSSVEINSLKNRLDVFFKYYYDSFVETLLKYKSDIPFTYENLLEEIAITSKYQFCKILFMLAFIIRGPKGGHLTSDPSLIPQLNVDHLLDYDKERLFWIIAECERRNWIRI